MSDNHDGLILDFCDVTGADAQQARHFLEASDWNISSATEQYYEAHDDTLDDAGALDDDDDDVYESPRPQAQTSSSSISQSKGSRSKFATLGDLSKSNDDDDESDEEHQDLFAGGEKSGLAVQNPGENKRGVVQDIIKRAEEETKKRHNSHDHREESGSPRSRFTGAGHTLGSEDTPSVTVPDPTPARPTAVQPVTRSLTFWRDGFSVEDGPLMRYDDPANQEILRSIQSGRAPLSIMNVEYGQPADVTVYRRMDEDYVPPKKKRAPFRGQGMRLGSPTPGGSQSAVSAPMELARTPPPTGAPSQPTAPVVNVDTLAPATTIQIRLGDGTRLISRFNHTHTVGDVYGFVNAASPEGARREYVLQTTFPNKELKDRQQSIKEAGLINAVVVQKWC
ncbi:protein phosphatase regulator [Rhizina undulata]